jgi:hypothetical protein
MIGADGKPMQLISGLPLPMDDKGRLDNVTFERCEFHPCCPNVKALGANLVECEQW